MMTKRSLVSLFVKMLAIYFLVRSIPSLLSIGHSLSLYSLRDFDSPGPFLIVLSSIFLLLVFGILMVIVIWKSDRLSKRFVTEDEPLFPIGKLSSEEVQNLAFSWIGILILVSGVSGVVYNLAYLLRIKFMVGAEQVKIPFIQNSAQFISSVAEIIIGVVLFLYPNGLVRFWHSIQRQRFVNKQPNEEEM
jgi:hypothetical protein